MPSLEIPQIPYVDALQGAASYHFRRIGKTVPMVAIIGVPLGHLADYGSSNPDIEYQTEGDFEESYTRLDRTACETFVDTVGGIMLANLDRVVTPHEYDFDNGKFYQTARPHLFAVHRQSVLGGSSVLGNDIGMHVDRKVTNPQFDVYGAHLTIEGGARVLARRATVVKQQKGATIAKYVNDASAEPLFERQASVGDLHVFMRRTKSTDNTRLFQRTPSATFHAFHTTTPTRTYIDYSYATN